MEGFSWSDLAPSIILDVVMTGLLLIGGLVGWFRGALKGAVVLASFIAPIIIYLHFSDVIADYIQIVLDLTAVSSTTSIGILGTMSGLLGGMALFGAFFLASRLVLFLMARHEPERMERIIGVVMGVVTNQAVALLFFMLVYMAMPASIATNLAPSLWWQGSAPLARLVYPTYKELILDRTEGLRAAIANDGVLKGLVAGRLEIDEDLQEEITNLAKDGVEQALDLSEDFFRNLNALDLNSVTEALEAADNASIKDVNRLIQQEDKRRRALIERRLKAVQ